MRIGLQTGLAVIAASLFFALPAAAQKKLEAKAEDSKIEFVGSKPDGKHAGGFKEFTATLVPNEDDHEKSKLTISISTASLFADDEKLTAHLKSPDFFNVRKHPKALFEATRLEKKSDKEGVIHGNLTLLDKTKEIAVPVKVDPQDEVVIVKAAFEIDRTDFGMDYGQGKINNKVKITAELHFPHEE